ncbi:Dyp-type peroxidase [Comamonas testosteroni]|uniref:Dyp-type peroxidase n=1 Tax=Comamonas testosteroni TaxID=285 RepID=A0A373FCG2_COMTE|nr:Dyp-type peroxidase [Comamonas testosteroni]RGE41152.1 Dyp-type peroxidase [Comamonas testosteroni]
MTQAQAGILAPVPAQARYVFYSLRACNANDLQAALKRLQTQVDGQQLVAGLGLQLVQHLDKQIELLHECPHLKGPQFEAPSTPSALCLWLGGDERGELIARTRELSALLAPALQLERVVDSFVHQRGTQKHGKDLTGYEDGTENPEDDEAVHCSIVQGQQAGLDGSSFWALQQWQHDFTAFDKMSSQAQDHAIGRRRSDNEELEDAPESAHVKRTAQESFEPEAFMLRRSMPWWQVSPQGTDQTGLMFSAFGCSFDAFEAQMRRMLGLEDGISDALFGFSTPLTGSYFWCPPMHNGQLDLRLLGIAA